MVAPKRTFTAEARRRGAKPMLPQMNSRRGRRSINAEPRQRRMKIARYARRKPRERLAPKCREKFEGPMESRQGRLDIQSRTYGLPHLRQHPGALRLLNKEP